MGMKRIQTVGEIADEIFGSVCDIMQRPHSPARRSDARVSLMLVNSLRVHSLWQL